MKIHRWWIGWWLFCLPTLAWGGPDDSTSSVGAAGTAAATPTVEDLLGKAEASIAKVNDYMGVMFKQERFKDGLREQEKMEFKFSRPFKVYIKYLQPFAGREALFVRNWNDNEVKVHKGSFPDITANLDPQGGMAMDGNHHPITDFGLENTIRIAAKNLREARKRGEGNFQVSEGALVDGKATWKIEGTFPKGGVNAVMGKDETLWNIAKRHNQDMYLILYANPTYDDPDDPDEGDSVFVPRYYGAKAEFLLDRESFLPMKVTIWDWNGRLYETFEYQQLRINVGLNNNDFDPNNSAYKF